MRLKLKRILKNESLRMQIGFIWPRITASEHANDHRVFIKGREFLEILGDYQLSKKKYAPWTQLVS